MKKQVFLTLACLVGAVQAFASGCCDTDYCCQPSDCCLDFDSKLYANIGGGLRWDSLDWKSSGFLGDSSSSGHFNQKWKDIKIGLIEANFLFLACEHYLLKGDFDYGWVYGKNNLHSSDFDSSDVSDSSSSFFSSKSKKGNAYDLSIGVGYQFNWDCYQIAFAPLVGYSYNHLKLNRHRNGPYSSELDGSSSGDGGSGHRFRLSGPWLGFAATYQATCEMQFYLDYAFHWASFRATVDNGFVVFDESATNTRANFRNNKTYGNEVTVGGTYTLCDCWFAGLKFNYKNWWGSKGHQHRSPYDFSDSSSSSVTDAHFRNFNWNTYTLTVDIGYTF